MMRPGLYMIRSTITVPTPVILNTRYSTSTVTRSTAWRMLVTGRYSSATSIKILLFDSMECIVNLSNTIKNLIELLSPFSYNRCMIYVNTDLSETTITPETVSLRMHIQDYLELATVPSMHRIGDFYKQISGIEDDRSRLALENWFFNQPEVQNLAICL